MSEDTLNIIWSSADKEVALKGGGRCALRWELLIVFELKV